MPALGSLDTKILSTRPVYFHWDVWKMKKETGERKREKRRGEERAGRRERGRREEETGERGRRRQ